jgi:inward rectifier potassium channel
MKQPSFDPGLTQQYGKRLRRAINPDGSFNVRREGLDLRNANYYLNLITMPWPRFLTLLLTAYFLVNCLFAVLYYAAGMEHLKGADMSSPFMEFASAFFFSGHTLTTVGYGNVTPEGLLTNSISSIEAMTGLLGFAIATGLLYGRFSKPTARLLFSEKMLVVPYQDGLSLQFRIANKRSNILMELEATVTLMTVEIGENGALQRKFKELKLERPKVLFLPLTWTIVHPIDADSPLYGKTQEDVTNLQVELIILIKCFDDTFGQTVHARYSYPHNEIVWNARFEQAFEIAESGDLVLRVDRVGRHKKLAAGA